MFSSNFDYVQVHFYGIDDKERGIYEDYPLIKNEYLIPITYAQNNTSCDFKDNIMNRDQLGKIEEENLESIHRKMGVMLRPHVNSSPLELIDSFNIEMDLKGIIVSSFCLNNEVCNSFTHSSEILFISLVELYVFFDAYPWLFFHKYSSCLGKHLNYDIIVRDIHSPFDVDHDNTFGIMRNLKVSMFLSFFKK